MSARKDTEKIVEGKLRTTQSTKITTRTVGRCVVVAVVLVVVLLKIFKEPSVFIRLDCVTMVEDRAR